MACWMQILPSRTSPDLILIYFFVSRSYALREFTSLARCRSVSSRVLDHSEQRPGLGVWGYTCTRLTDVVGIVCQGTQQNVQVLYFWAW